MPQFRKKPIVIEAMQMPLMDQDVPEGFIDWLDKADSKWLSGRDQTIDIFTLEGTMTANPGDWIIRGVERELYPCKPDIFAKTYEAVCRECGCTEDNACVAGPFNENACHWVEPDLCSACAPEAATPEQVTHFVLIKRVGVYVKEGAYFEEQGGLTEPWGEFWEPIDAASLDDARQKAIKIRRQRFPNSHLTIGEIPTEATAHG